MAQTHDGVAAPSPSSSASDSHPLDLIPFFRRWKQNHIRDLVYTFIFGLGFCFFFFALYAIDAPHGHLLSLLWKNFVMAMSISYTIHGLYVLGDMLLGSWLSKLQGWQRAAYHIVIPTGGVFGGFYVAVAILDPTAALHNVDGIFTTGVIVSFATISLVVSCVLVLAYAIRERQLRDTEHIAAEQRRALEAERQALEAQLRMLQAQIEPHFLYNTLANAVGLIQPAPERARVLLERLIDYLRASLAASRDTSATLGNEVATISAYLDLMKVRMGERLRYRIDLPPELAACTLPPMLLQPLVENAISHGLEPKIAGGEIVVRCTAEADVLLVTVEDDGVGFDPTARPRPGGGVGLTNLRQRLAALYGNAASVGLADNQPAGVRVSLRIPMTAERA
ncbi:MAG: sensor histidine kinase [Burkholderiales bacterium]|nr:sensor histidine kinase [Burkholderiales bacterium]